MYLISVVTRSNTHLVREMNNNLESKQCFDFWKKISVESDLANFQDLIMAVDACFWLHNAIWISLSRFGDDRRCDFLLLIRFYVLLGAEFTCNFFVSEWKRPVVHRWICLNEKISSISSVFDGPYYRAGEREQTLSAEQSSRWEILHRLSLRASSPIWASEASLARTREQAVKPN